MAAAGPVSNRLPVLTAGIVALVALGGCAGLLGGRGELPQRRYYALAVEPLRRPLAESERPYALQVQVRTFEVLRAYNRNEIIYRRDRYELKRDGLHGWAVRPGDMVTDCVVQYLRQADLFASVGGDREFLERRPDLILTGQLRVIERYDSGDLWAARLAASLELVRQSDGQVIWRGEFDHEKSVYNADMTYTVAALSEILRSQMEGFVRDIDFVLLNQKRLREGRPLAVVAPDSSQATAVDSLPVADTRSPAGRDYELIPGKLAP